MADAKAAESDLGTDVSLRSDLKMDSKVVRVPSYYFGRLSSISPNASAITF